MKDEIVKAIANPEKLEELYHHNEAGFKSSFYEVYSEIASEPLSAFWKVRLDFVKAQDKPLSFAKNEILFLLLSCLFTGFLIKIPQLFEFKGNHAIFYERNTGWILFFGLSLYAFLTKKTYSMGQIGITAAVFLLSIVYINLLPNDHSSHSIILAAVHLPFLFWCLYGLLFIDFNLRDVNLRMNYVKHCADIAILGVLLLLAGAILTGITLGLFSAIDINIESFYFDYIVVIGLVSSPIVATYIVKYYPTVTNKIAPIISTIFSPLALITLLIYLFSILATGKNPYHDREFLIVFNAMLLGVMVLIIFSVGETSQSKKQQFSEMILFSLCLIAILIDAIALSAIVYRVLEYGISPNRAAVLGSNVLMLVNLIYLFKSLNKVIFNAQAIVIVENSFGRFLPYYAIWVTLVTFVWPLLFGMK